jgi:hypothetical protein
MAGPINVNSNFNLNTKRVMSKLSFELGETFMARIVNLDEKGSELLLKLLNGWQFNAKLENPLELVPNGLVKFVVEGFDGEELLIKLVHVKEGEGEQSSSIENILKDQNFNASKEDFGLLEKMVKSNITLTKENIASIKTLVDFKTKLEANEGEKDAFINKYINSKSIDINSAKGRSIKETLDSFFKELKDTGIDDLLTLKENNIEVTDENMKSFNKIFKEPKAIYRSIMEVSKALQGEMADIDNYNRLENKIDLTENKSIGDPKEIIQNENETIDENGNLNRDTKVIEKNEIFNKNTKVIEKNELFSKDTKVIEKTQIFNKDTKEIEENQIFNKDAKTVGKNEISNKDIKIVEKNEIFNKTIKVIEESEILNKDTKDLAENINFKSENKAAENKTLPLENKPSKEDGPDTKVQSRIENNEGKDTIDNLIQKQDSEKNIIFNDKDTSRLVKEEITIKTSQLKDIINNLIEEKVNLKPEAYDKLLQNIKGNINDFKVFNSVSNQYYYLDMPLKVRDEEYDCKLIIKDDRKKDKSIDTKNVKLVVTVSTGNMGIVDSYIKVNNKNMNIDIKCEGAWVKVLNLSKDEILKGLDNSGYSIHISVEKKLEEASLTNCSDFFNDGSISSINTRA